MNKRDKKIKRQARVRKEIRGTKEKPRLSVYRSNRYMAVQVIDDVAGKTICGLTEKHLKDSTKKGVEKAKELGLAIAKMALEKKIKQVVFDRGSYAYHGNVKAVAEGVREGGLTV